MSEEIQVVDLVEAKRLRKKKESRRYYLKHKRYCLATAAKWKVENKARTQQYSLEYYKENRAAILTDQAARYTANKEKFCSVARKYYNEHREEVAAKVIKRRLEHPEIFRERNLRNYQKDRAGAIKRVREWRAAHRARCQAYARTYNHKYTQDPAHKALAIKRTTKRAVLRRQVDPTFRLSCNLRNRVARALRDAGRVTKTSKTVVLLGCTPTQLRAYLELQFTPTMNWENYGSYWHVDHKLPCAAFDLTKPEQQFACFNFSNLQPLEAKANRDKSDRILPEFQLQQKDKTCPPISS